MIVQFGNLFLSKFNPNHADNSPDRLKVDYLIIPFLEENILKVQFLAQVSIDCLIIPFLKENILKV